LATSENIPSAATFGRSLAKIIFSKMAQCGEQVGQLHLVAWLSVLIMSLPEGVFSAVPEDNRGGGSRRGAHVALKINQKNFTSGAQKVDSSEYLQHEDARVQQLAAVWVATAQGHLSRTIHTADFEPAGSREGWQHRQLLTRPGITKREIVSTDFLRFHSLTLLLSRRLYYFCEVLLLLDPEVTGTCQ
jgi:hypothetical protein